MTKTATVTNTITATGPGATATVTATTTQPPGTTTFPPPATTSTISPTVTAGELAASGGTLYNKTCTYPECHANFGEGGEDEFTATKLSSFNNAERVFNLISSIMHLNIGDYEEDAPSLDDYMQILAYILIQNDIVQSNDLFGRSNLPDISIMAPTNPTVTTTAGELAGLGGMVYSNTCVLTYCHGPWDADGKTEFAATSWEYFGDAQGYFGFVKRFMPGEDPGSLSDEQYLQAIAFILVELDKVQEADLFGLGNLASIRLDFVDME